MASLLKVAKKGFANECIVICGRLLDTFCAMHYLSLAAAICIKLEQLGGPIKDVQRDCACAPWPHARKISICNNTEMLGFSGTQFMGAKIGALKVR